MIPDLNQHSTGNRMKPAIFPATPLLTGVDTDLKRQQIRDYFHATFDRYEQLFDVLTCDEAYYVKPIALRHPLIFYFGHTATFFINKLVLAGLIEQRINPGFESMFAIGVDEMSWDDLSDQRYDWPRVDEVRAYRQAVRATVSRLIESLPLNLPIGWEDPWWLIVMGIEHERIHLETSSVLIRQHQLKYVQKHPAWEPCHDSGVAPSNTLVDILPQSYGSVASVVTRKSTAGTTNLAVTTRRPQHSRPAVILSRIASFSLSLKPAAMPTTHCGWMRVQAGRNSPKPNTRRSGSRMATSGACA